MKFIIMKIFMKIHIKCIKIFIIKKMIVKANFVRMMQFVCIIIL